MNNQLTKIENGKIIKKENVTEQQLIERLYKYERFGTVGKIEKIIKELEVNDDIWGSQLDFARAEAEYLQSKLNDYKERYENLKREFDFSVKFREINRGLREQCQKYKQQLAESDAYKLRIELAGAEETIEVLKQQLAEKEKLLENLKSKICGKCRKCIQKNL